MADVCVFCGEGLSLFNRRELFCCTTKQPTCKDCYAKLIKLPREEQGRRALATGRAEEPEKIRIFLAQREKTSREQELVREQAEKDRISDKLCPHCGIPMLKMGQQQFQLGEYSFFWGDLAHLAAGSLTLDLLYCETCRKVEFFLPEDPNAPSGDC